MIYTIKGVLSPQKIDVTHGLSRRIRLSNPGVKLSRGRHGEFGGSKTLHICHTVDGRNPAPVDR